MSTTPPLPNPQLTALEQRVAALEIALAVQKAAIHYDDATKTITLHTPIGQSIGINDGTRSISLKDTSDNSITMSPTGIAIATVDEVAITLHTASGQTIAIDDANKSITLKDESNNSITMSPTGIAIVSPYDISLKASGNITQTAQANVTMSAVGNLHVATQQIELEAQTSFSAKASATAEVSASGMLTLKGALVSIN